MTFKARKTYINWYDNIYNFVQSQFIFKVHMQKYQSNTTVITNKNDIHE